MSIAAASRAPHLALAHASTKLSSSGMHVYTHTSTNFVTVRVLKEIDNNAHYKKGRRAVFYSDVFKNISISNKLSLEENSGMSYAIASFR
jgi:hypothetical protein